MGRVPRDETAVEAFLGRDRPRRGVFAASGGGFWAISGASEQKSLFKHPKMVYNNRTKVPDPPE
jgi:hypothetical protein